MLSEPIDKYLDQFLALVFYVTVNSPDQGPQSPHAYCVPIVASD